MKEGMTKEEFISDYCGHTDMSVDEVMKYRVALPCACDEYKYVHWGMVFKDDELIKHHMLVNSTEAQK